MCLLFIATYRRIAKLLSLFRCERPFGIRLARLPAFCAHDMRLCLDFRHIDNFSRCVQLIRARIVVTESILLRTKVLGEQKISHECMVRSTLKFDVIVCWRVELSILVARNIRKCSCFGFGFVDIYPARGNSLHIKTIFTIGVDFDARRRKRYIFPVYWVNNLWFESSYCSCVHETWSDWKGKSDVSLSIFRSQRIFLALCLNFLCLILNNWNPLG